MLRYEEKELVKELRNFLDETSYDIINQKLRKEQYFFDPLPAYEQVKPAVQSLDEKISLRNGIAFTRRCGERRKAYK